MTSRAKKRLIAISILLLIVVAGVGAYVLRNSLRQRTLARALDAGMAAYAKGDYAKGMEHLSVYVGRIKTNAPAILALAECRRNIPLENSKHLASALSLARAAAKVAPSDPKPLEIVMELCSQLGLTTEAREAAESLLAIDPGHRGALTTRTQVLLAVGKVEQALEAAHELARRHPDAPQSHDAVVYVMLQLKRDPTAIAAYAAQVTGEHAGDLGFALFQSKTAMSIEDREGAVAALRRAAQLPIRNAQQLAALTKAVDLLRVRIANGDEALPTPEDILARTVGNPELAIVAALIRAERSWKSGQHDEAARSLPAPVATMSTAQSGLWAVIRDLQGADCTHAIAELEEQPGSDAAYWAAILRGRAAFAKNDIKTAMREFKMAESLDRSSGFAQYFLGEALAKAGDWSSAATQFDVAARTDPAWREARFASISLLARNGRFDEARRQAREGVTLRGLWPEVYLYLEVSVSMLEAGQGPSGLATEVLAETERIRNESPEDPSLTTLRARALLAAGQEREAARLAETLVDADPPPPQDSLSRLAIGFHRKGSPLGKRLQAAADRGMSSPVDTIILRARCLVAAGHPDEAVSVLSLAGNDAKGVDRTRLLLELGRLQDAMGDSRAGAVLIAVAAEEPSNPSLQLALLESQSAWSDQAAIVTALGRLESIIGESAPAYVLYDCRRRLRFSPAEAKERSADAARVVKNLTPIAMSDPRNVLASLLLSEAQLALDDRTGAIATLSRCVDAEPTGIAAYPRLVALLQQSGRASEAEMRLMSFKMIRDLPLTVQRHRAELLRVQGLRTEYSQELAELAARGATQDRVAYAIERSEAGDTAAAERLFEGLLAEPSVPIEVLEVCAEYFADHAGIDKGLAVLEGAGQNADQGRSLTAKIGLLARHGRQAEAERLLRERAASEGTAAAWSDLAQFYLTAERLDDATSAAASGLALFPNDDQLRRVSAFAKVRAGNASEDTAKELASVFNSASAPDDIRAIAQAIQQYERDKDEGQLIVALQAVTQKIPTSFEAWRQLVGAYSNAGQVNEAVAAALMAARSIPGDKRAARLATEVLAQTGRTQEAIAMAERWRRLAPAADSLMVDLVLARLKFLNAQIGDAVRMLSVHESEILKRAGDHPDDLELYAAALAGSGRSDKAWEIIGVRAGASTDWRIRCYRVGQVMVKTPQDARSWLMRLDPGKEAAGNVLVAAAEAWCVLGAVSGKAEDSDTGLRLAIRAAAVPECRGPASKLLGAIYLQRGQGDLALPHYRTARQDLPEDAEVANNLAYILSSRPADYDEAASLSGVAVDLAERQRVPPSTLRNYLETQGTAELRRENCQKAKAAYEAGLRIDPTGVDLLLGLLESEECLKNLEEARRLLGRARSLAGSAAVRDPHRTRIEAASRRLESTR